MTNWMEIASEYFKTQPSFCLLQAPKIKNEVTKLWLLGHEDNDIVLSVVKSDLGIEAVKSCKRFISVIVRVDVDAENVTNGILKSFLYYLFGIIADHEKMCDKTESESLARMQAENT